MSETLEEFIQRHEGCRVTPYIDSVGVQTIGVGHNLHKPFPMNVIELLRDEDIKDAKNDCLHAFPWAVVTHAQFCGQAVLTWRKISCDRR